MTAAELITLIAGDVGAAWSRAQILDALNRAQNELLGTDNDISRVKPDPFLTTADETYSYTATAGFFDSSAGTKGSAVGDVRCVRKIYSFSSTLDTFGFHTLDPGSAKPYQVIYGASVDNVGSPISVIQSKKASDSDCVIKWWEGNNPGVTTIVWRGEVYLWPTQLTAETVSLTMPDDFCDTLLLYAVVRRLERREYGREDASRILYEKEYRRFKTKYSATPSQDGPLKASPLRC